MRAKTLLLIVLLTSLISGCGMFTPEYVASEGKSRILTDVFMCWGEMAVYDSGTNSIIPIGWEYLGNYEGRTLKDYNWQEYIAAQKNGATDDR